MSTPDNQIRRTARRKATRRQVPPALKALGKRGLPPQLVINGQAHTLSKTLKHDFFAATGLYANESQAAPKVVLKLGRQTEFLGIPLAWLGRWLADREARMYQMLADVTGVPRLLGRYAETGFAHVFVEGHPLQRREHVPDTFFPELQKLLQTVHAREAAYVDLEKRENIIVGDDGRPYLIDFQISWHRRGGWGGSSRFARWFLRRLQAGDRYHLLKHWRRHRPDQLDPETLARARDVPYYIKAHRLLAAPFQAMRRRTLARLDSLRDRAGRNRT